MAPKSSSRYLPSDEQTIPQMKESLGGSEHISFDRINSEEAYRSKLRRHNNIKKYASSPLKGTPLIEQPLNVLLKNGYSIDELHNAYAALQIHSTGREQLQEQLAKKREALMKTRPNEVESSMRYTEDMINKSKQRSFQFTTGIHDQSVIEQLIALSPEFVGSPSIAIALPELPNADGERILTDDDWMSESHRKAFASYQGEPRKVEFGRMPEAPGALKMEPVKMEAVKK
jgi:hypothetical protein